MLIGIDGNEANIKNRVGVNVYAFELLRNIYKLQGEWENRFQFVIYLSSPALFDMPKETSVWKYRVIPGGSFWIVRKLMLNLLISQPRPQMFFSPFHYVPPLALMPRVCSIMDLGYLENSGQFKLRDFWQLKYWSAWSIFVSKYIIAISNTTKDDIMRHYRFAKNKTFVTKLAYDKNEFSDKILLKEIKRVKRKHTTGDSYILFLSTLKPSKNVLGLVRVWSLIEKKYPKVNLVIAGKKGWLFEEIFEEVKRLGIDKRVVFTDFIPEKDKPGLIGGAKVFILPSFWEGFGLDVLNAMACGVVVVLSNIGSLPEVGGEAGVYINPNDDKDIAKGISRVLSMNKKEYNKWAMKGLRQAGQFSWEKTARETLAIFGNFMK